MKKKLQKISDPDLPNPNCKICKGEGWVCENHPKKVWSSSDYANCCDCGAGMPCECNPLSKAGGVEPIGKEKT